MDVDGDDVEARIALANLLVKQGQFKRARALYTEALRVIPELSEVMDAAR